MTLTLLGRPGKSHKSLGREGLSCPSFSALQRGSGYSSTQAMLGPRQLAQQRLHCPAQPRQWLGGQAAEFGSLDKLAWDIGHAPLCVKG